MAEDRLDDLVLAVDQAASSGIEHSAGRPGPIWVDGHMALGQIRLVVTDYGPRRASNASPEPGLELLRCLTDHAHAERVDGATAITMVWDVSKIRLSSTREEPVLADRA
jgi:anti-sigma regulatory factor (Ser/Thr protein kinase)